MNRWISLHAGVLSVLLVLGLSTEVRADQVSIVSSRDNTLYEDSTGSLSDGAGVTFFVGRVGTVGGGKIRRGLVYFDVAGNVPSGSRIDSVSLQLDMSKTVSGDAVVSLHKVTSDWGEGASNAGVNGGKGATAMTGDATWVYTFYNTSSWTTLGGDFVTSASASTTVGGTLGFYIWGSTPQMVQDVQGWLNSPSANFGWLVQGDESVESTTKAFDSHETATAANRPTLTVTYTPAPAKVRDWLIF